MKQLVLFIFCLFSNEIQTQTINFDSLYSLLDTASVVEHQIDLHIKIGAYKKFSEDSIAYYHINRAVTLADSAKLREKYVDALYYKSTVVIFINRFNEGMDVLDKIEHILENDKNGLNPDFVMERKLWVAQTKSYLQIILNQTNDAIETRFMILDLIPEVYEKDSYNYHLELGLANNGLALAYVGKNDSLSVQFSSIAIKHFKAISYYPSYLFESYCNIVESKINLGVGFYEISPFLDTISNLAERTGSNKHLALVFSMKCQVYAIFEFYEQSLQYCNKAFEFKELLDDSLRVSSIYFARGKTFVHTNKPQYAIAELQQSILLSDSTIQDETRIQAFELLADSYAKLGKYQEAVKFYKQHSKLLESQFQKNLKERFTEAEAKYQSSQKEAEIAQQKLQIQKQKNTQNLLIGGAVTGFAFLLIIIFGITQRNKQKKRETELALHLEQQRAKDIEELSKSKTDFFNNVSHELRTPITLVIAPLKDVINKIKHVDLREELQMALHNSKRLLSLTNEILDLSKLDSAKLKLELSNINLNSFLRRIFHSFDSLARSRNVQLIDNISPDNSFIIQTDIGKLEKIISNLVSNAIKYSGDYSMVGLHVEYDDLKNSNLHFIVSDSGKGIPQEEQAYVFDRFFQSSATSHSSGTGIGLALVRELIELLGGRILLESEIGKGSRFDVLIPVQFSSEKLPKETIQYPDIQEALFPPLIIEGNKPRILIVEDDLLMSRYLVSILRKEYICETVYNGVQALDILKRQHFDLISSDIMMPELDGFEFREEINKNPKWRNTPFIMLTARVLEEDKLKGFQLGIDDYITKPFSSEEFRARIYSLLKNKVERDSLKEAEKQAFSFEENFLQLAKNLVMDHLNDPDFSVEKMAKRLNYSQRQVSRILRRLTGFSPVSFILEIRLQKAYQLIRDRKYSTINEVRYDVGIESASYFSAKFKERFGIMPSELEY